MQLLMQRRHRSRWSALCALCALLLAASAAADSKLVLVGPRAGKDTLRAVAKALENTPGVVPLWGSGLRPTLKKLKLKEKQLSDDAQAVRVARALDAEGLLVARPQGRGKAKTLGLTLYSLEGEETWHTDVKLNKGRLTSDAAKALAEGVAQALAGAKAKPPEPPSPRVAQTRPETDAIEPPTAFPKGPGEAPAKQETPPPQDSATAKAPLDPPPSQPGVNPHPAEPPPPRASLPEPQPQSPAQPPSSPQPAAPPAQPPPSPQPAAPPAQPALVASVAPRTEQVQAGSDWDDPDLVPGVAAPPPRKRTREGSVAIPFLELALGGATLWRNYEFCPGVSRCGQKVIDPTTPIRYVTDAPYVGAALQVTTFPLAHADSPLRGLGVTGRYARGFLETVVPGTTGQTVSLPSYDEAYAAEAVYRLAFHLGAGEPSVGVRAGVQGRSFVVPANAAITESRRRLAPLLGLELAFPLWEPHVRLEATARYVWAPLAGSVERQAYGNDTLTSAGLLASAGFGGQFDESWGYTLMAEFEGFADTFTGTGERANGGAAHEEYIGLVGMIHYRF